jgi:protein transport protein SEC61 subunit gamma-like protein|tara:strand:+ start:597 stop:794 length:198 start_codon:yes stop_codon:yes gene_type:complete
MEEGQKRSLGSKLKSFFLQNKRVLKVTKKPSRDEYKITLKVSGLGILLIGFIGFIIYMIGMMITK